MKRKNNSVEVVEEKEEVVEEVAATEEGGVGNVDGHPLSTPEACVSFKRYVYSVGVDNPGVPANLDPTPGMVPQVESLPIPGVSGGDTLTQDDVIIHEHWCTLFDMSCP